MTSAETVRDIANMKMSKNETAALVLRVLMGGWFVYAGGIKIFASGLDQFAADLGNYRMMSDEIAIAAGYFVPWFEVVAGICFMLGILKKGAWLAMFGLVVAFTVSVGSAWWRGLDISCGCLGGTEKISYWGKAAEFALYFASLAYIAWVECLKFRVSEGCSKLATE
ncbi:MAG: DoxX family protein [Akkermansiaceae bacterium]|nr:DoxX family protein [Akkermansiaceae bacterium]MDP4647558.1 DoxX family protein [Akkermansiaceae bacterium]